jgi:type IV secretory pathway VirB3-like protein
MMENNQVLEYPLFVALTRPPMMLGVTQTFFVLNSIPCFCFLILTKNIVLSVGVFLILHVVGVIGCAKDDHFFEVLLGKLELACPNKTIWGCHSYDPE